MNRVYCKEKLLHITNDRQKLDMGYMRHVERCGGVLQKEQRCGVFQFYLSMRQDGKHPPTHGNYDLQCYVSRLCEISETCASRHFMVPPVSCSVIFKCTDRPPPHPLTEDMTVSVHMVCGESACEYFKEFFESAMRDALPRHRTWGLERIIISSLKMLDGTLEETSHIAEQLFKRPNKIY